ncbi:unnamed protein product [Prorocentrum cordatum]|nr:unnamed protein product [Polarella glacialis]
MCTLQMDQIAPWQRVFDFSFKAEERAAGSSPRSVAATARNTRHARVRPTESLCGRTAWVDRGEVPLRTSTRLALLPDVLPDLQHIIGVRALLLPLLRLVHGAVEHLMLEVSRRVTAEFTNCIIRVTCLVPTGRTVALAMSHPTLRRVSQSAEIGPRALAQVTAPRAASNWSLSAIQALCSLAREPRAAHTHAVYCCNRLQVVAGQLDHPVLMPLPVLVPVLHLTIGQLVRVLDPCAVVDHLLERQRLGELVSTAGATLERRLGPRMPTGGYLLLVRPLLTLCLDNDALDLLVEDAAADEATVADDADGAFRFQDCLSSGSNLAHSNVGDAGLDVNFEACGPTTSYRPCSSNSMPSSSWSHTSASCSEEVACLVWSSSGSQSGGGLAQPIFGALVKPLACTSCRIHIACGWADNLTVTGKCGHVSASPTAAWPILGTTWQATKKKSIVRPGRACKQVGTDGTTATPLTECSHDSEPNCLSSILKSPPTIHGICIVSSTFRYRYNLNKIARFSGDNCSSTRMYRETMTKPLLPPQLTCAATMRPGSNVGPSSAGGAVMSTRLGTKTATPP